MHETGFLSVDALIPLLRNLSKWTETTSSLKILCGTPVTLQLVTGEDRTVWWRAGWDWLEHLIKRRCMGLAWLLLTYAHRSWWSTGHQRPLVIALCSGLFWPFRTPAVSALLQCLASNCCEAGLSSSSPAGSRSGLDMWCWMLASWGCVRSSPISSTVSARPLDRLVGLVVKVSASGTEDPGFKSRLHRDFSGSSHTSDLKIWHSSGYPARRLAL